MTDPVDDTPVAQPRLTALDSKANAEFPGLVVRKDLVSRVRGNAVVPGYVLEFLLAPATGIPTIAHALKAGGLPPAQYSDMGLRFTAVLRTTADSRKVPDEAKPLSAVARSTVERRFEATNSGTTALSPTRKALRGMREAGERSRAVAGVASPTIRPSNPRRRENRRTGRRHAGAPSGGGSSTRGLYSTSWMRPSKVRCSIISRATSG